MMLGAKEFERVFKEMLLKKHSFGVSEAALACLNLTDETASTYGFKALEFNFPPHAYRMRTKDLKAPTAPVGRRVADLMKAYDTTTHIVMAVGKSLSEVEASIEYALALGARKFVLHASDLTWVFPWQDAAAISRAHLAYIIKKYENIPGISISIENTEPYSLFGNVPDQFAGFFGGSVGWCADISHLQQSHLRNKTISPAKAIRNNAADIRVIHLSDVSMDGKSHCAPGTGTVDWSSVVPAIKETNARIVLEVGEREVDQSVKWIKANFDW